MTPPDAPRADAAEGVWQPIATVPDTAMFIAWDSEDGQPMLAFSHNGKTYWAHCLIAEDAAEHDFTHWQPLPKTRPGQPTPSSLRDAVVAAAVACRHAYDYAHGPEDDAWIDLRRAVDAYEAASGGRG